MAESYQYICGTCNKDFTLRSHPKRIKLFNGRHRCASCRAIWRWKVSPRSGWKRESPSAIVRAKISASLTGRPHPLKGIPTGRAAWNRGIPQTLEAKAKVSKSKKGKPSPKRGKPSRIRGSLHYNWKGGITAERAKLRTSLEYIEWRRLVFERDKFKCQECAYKSHLEADHIKPFALFPELRLELSNGRTLCYKCHKKKTAADRKLYKERQCPDST